MEQKDRIDGTTVNVLGFELARPYECTEARILIDGVPLLDRIRDYERPFAEAEKWPDGAGAYMSLSVGETFLPSKLLYGVPPADEFFPMKKCPLLICPCDCYGCWDLACDIVFEEQAVWWCGFQLSGRRWDYGGFGPFVFDRRQYEDALWNHVP